MTSAHVCARAGCGAELPSGSTQILCFTCGIREALETKNASDLRPPTNPPIVVPYEPVPAAGARIADYEVIDTLATGGMGVILRARQISLNRIVALKMILTGRFASAEEVGRFRLETEAIAAMDHPHIVPIYDVGQDRGCHYFSMKLVEGRTLAGRLSEFLPDPKRSARLMAKVARAVHYAHQRGILHRDLKPENVLVAADDHPYLTDFGIARRIEGGKTFTLDGEVVGTPEYMAPEQATGDKSTFTTAVDVYGLGAILYALLTGTPPFRGASPIDTLRQVTEKEPARPRSVSPTLDADLETICLKCLEKDPRRRYGSAEKLAEDLERWLSGETIQARQATVVERAIKWARRRPWKAGLAGVSLFSLLVLLAGWGWFTRKLNDELTHTEQARQALQVALARQVAERLDGDLRRLSTVPQMIATMLSQRADWSEAQLEGCLREMLGVDDRLFGLCAAFEPSQFNAGRADYALYCYRAPGGLTTKVLTPESYQPLYREWNWYRSARSQGLPVWIPPYLDKGGGEIWMSTRSVPFERAGQFAGVVTADLSIDKYVTVVRGWLDELQLGPESYAFVVDQTDSILTHPKQEFFRKKLVKLCEGLGAERNRASSEPVRAIDGSTGRLSSFTFVPLASTEWTFAVVVPERAPSEPPRGRWSGQGADR